MIKIAICEDIKEELDYAVSCLSEYRKLHSEQDIQFAAFSSSMSLSDDIQKKGYFDIYILDILMPGMTGLQLAEQIRETDHNAVIIFLTSTKDYALDAFQVYAYQYCVKPVKKERLFSVLDRAVLLLSPNASDFLPLKTRDGIVRINFHSIVYIELLKHSVYFHLSDSTTIKSINLRISFDDFIEPLMKDSRFIRTHKSFLANSFYIKKLLAKHMEMEDGTLIPISRSYLSDVRKQYIKFIMDSGIPLSGIDAP